jgi:UDP-glucose 4-epimerase
MLAMTSDKVGKGEVINIGNADNRSVNEIANMIGGPVIYVDPVVEPRETLADNSQAKDLLGWYPSVEIEEWVPIYKKDIGI